MSSRRGDPFRVTLHGPMLVLPSTSRDDERAEDRAARDEDPGDHDESGPDAPTS